MNMIPNETDVHKMYDEMEKQKRMRQYAMSKDPNPYFPKGRQPFMSSPSRNSRPSFRSVFFNVGEGIQVLHPGETKILAKITVPGHHAGVLTGFSQWFGAECVDDVQNSVTWGLRIDGLVPQGFMDFVGTFSTLMFPHSVYFPLAGGAASLGDLTTSVGGSGSNTNAATALLKATNNFRTSVVLQGRLEGYTFPTAERTDEFSGV
jgi:hypothetical protein